MGCFWFENLKVFILFFFKEKRKRPSLYILRVMIVSHNFWPLNLILIKRKEKEKNEMSAVD